MSNNTENRKLFVILMHILGLCFLLIPIAGVLPSLIFFLASEDKIVKMHSREALNFQISFLIYLAISGVLIFLLIGLLTTPLLYLFGVVTPIIAAVKASENLESVWRYPLAIRFLKEDSSTNTETVVDAVSSETKE